MPGDVNHDYHLTILDVTYLINFLYKNGMHPITECMYGYPEADTNDDGAVNVLDVLVLINYLYKNGPAPVCGDCWPPPVK